jgi:hypothetical protein
MEKITSAEKALIAVIRKRLDGVKKRSNDGDGNNEPMDKVR